MSTFLLSALPSFAQSLEGKWNIAQINTRNSTLIEFTKDSLIFYDFDKRHEATSYHIKDNRIIVDGGSIPLNGEFQFISPQRLRLKPDVAKKPIDFVRLEPTKTTLTKDEIAQLHFEIDYRNHPLSVNFNQVEDAAGKTVHLETIDSTYFLSFYRNNTRMGAMPIKEVTQKEIVVYGFPEKPFEVTGERVTSNAGSAKTDDPSSNEKLNTAEAIRGKWFYEHIEGRPALTDCTKKTFFQFKGDSALQIKPYAENHSNGDCVAGSVINGTYKLVGGNQIKVIQNGKTETWKIKSITKTELVVENNGGTLTLKKQ